MRDTLIIAVMAFGFLALFKLAPVAHAEPVAPSFAAQQTEAAH